MKLEAVNGNLLSLTLQQQQHQQQEQQLKVEPKEEEMIVDDEGVDKETEEERQNGESTDDKDLNGGKKKGVRKKRSLNWEEAERGLLLEVIKPKVEFVENRSVEAKNIKSKRLAWMQITKQFNMLNFRHRSLEQIQVQWRSMKNSAKRDYQLKHDKAEPPDAMDMIEFMEEMLKEPSASVRSTRGAAAAAHKKDISDSVPDSDEEDTPLAALPTSTNNSDDTLQSSTIAIPSPPPVSAAESQSESYNTPTRMRKKPSPQHKPTQMTQSAAAAAAISVEGTNGKMRKQRKQSINQDTISAAAAGTEFTNTINPQLPNAIIPPTSSPSFNTTAVIQTLAADEKYRKQLFSLVKRARLAEMDYARREHEQRLRHEELKWNLCRQQEELKMRNLREEHETRMRQYREEHEARILAYSIPAKRLQANSAAAAGNAVN